MSRDSGKLIVETERPSTYTLHPNWLTISVPFSVPSKQKRETLNRQEMESSTLASQQAFEKNGIPPETVNVSFDYISSFGFVNDMLETISSGTRTRISRQTAAAALAN